MLIELRFSLNGGFSAKTIQFMSFYLFFFFLVSSILFVSVFKTVYLQVNLITN